CRPARCRWCRRCCPSSPSASPTANRGPGHCPRSRSPGDGGSLAVARRGRGEVLVSAARGEEGGEGLPDDGQVGPWLGETGGLGDGLTGQERVVVFAEQRVARLVAGPAVGVVAGEDLGAVPPGAAVLPVDVDPHLDEAQRQPDPIEVAGRDPRRAPALAMAPAASGRAAGQRAQPARVEHEAEEHEDDEYMSGAEARHRDPPPEWAFDRLCTPLSGTVPVPSTQDAPFETVCAVPAVRFSRALNVPSTLP